MSNYLSQQDPSRRFRGSRLGRLLGGTSVSLIALSALSAPFMLSTSAHAQAERDIRGQTVFQRPRERFDAAGVQAGGFIIKPRITVEGEFDDNIFAAETNETDDFITTVSPAVNVESTWSRHKLSFGGRADFIMFADNGEQDTQEFGLFGRLDLDVSRTTQASLGASFDRYALDRADPNDGGRTDPSEVNQTGFDGSITRRFNRIEVSVNAGATDYDFLSSLDSDDNRTVYDISTRVSYIHSANLSIFAEPYYQMRDYDKDLSSGGLNLDSNVVGARVGATYDITGIISGDSSIGYYNTSPDDASLSDESGLSIRSRTIWNITPRTSLIGTLSRSNVESSAASTSSANRSRAQVEVQHELYRNVLIGGQVSFQNDDFTNTNRDDDTIGVGATAQYLVNRFAAVTAGWNYTDRDSNTTGESFSRNIFRVGVRAQF